MIKSFSEFITSHYKCICILFLLTTGIFLFGISKLTTRNNYDGDLGESDPIIESNNYLSEFFGKKHLIIIGMKSQFIFHQKTLQKILDISEELKNVDHIIEDEIVSLANMNVIAARNDELDIGPLLSHIPESEEEMASIEEKVLKNPLLMERIVSRDGTSTAIIASVGKGYDQATVMRHVNEIIQRYSGPEEFFVSGEPAMQQSIDNGIQKDISRLLPIAIILILIGFFISFRTFYGVFLPFLVVLLSILWTLGFMGFSGLPITVVSSSIPILMVAIASSYGIHLLHRYYEQKDSDPSIKSQKVIQEMFPAVTMTGITSALGSATLLVFKMQTIKEFGIITSVGIMFVICISLIFLPALLCLCNPGRKTPSSTSEFLDSFLDRITVYSIKHKNAVIVATIVILGISLYGTTRIRVGFDFVEYFPKEHILRKAFDFFDYHLGGARYFYVMFEFDNIDDVYEPHNLNTILNFQKFVESLPKIETTRSIVDILKYVNMTMHNEDSLYNKIPSSRNDIGQYLTLYSLSTRPGEYNDIVDNENKRTKMVITVSTSDQSIHKKIYGELLRYSKENIGEDINIFIGGMLIEQIARIKHLVLGKLQNVILAVLIVFLFCTIIYRSFKTAIVTIIPLSIGTLSVFGLMGFLNIRLEMSTAIITSISVGIGVDFAIHYMLRFKRKFALFNDVESACLDAGGSSGKAIVFDMFSDIIGFIVFTFSGFLPIAYFGWLVSLTMLSVGSATLIVLPAVLSKVGPKAIINN